MHGGEKNPAQTLFADASRYIYIYIYITPTYSVSVLAGNLGRVSMSTQEMVRVLHSEHSHSAGQESTCEPALIRRMTSVNRTRVITCMPEKKK